jgi:DNA-binding GntR family transcriptional regulator
LSATSSSAAVRAASRRIEMVPTLSSSVYEHIKREIFEFQLPPGQRFSEQSLANRLGVSRTPLRLALHVLARDGYLSRFDGHSGWQVKPFDLAYYEDLYDFRVQIELVAVRRLCTMQPPPDLSALRAFWSDPSHRRLLDGQRVAREDEKFHNVLVALAGNREMLRTHVDLTERIRIIRRLDFVAPARIESAFDEHNDILAALASRQTAQAEVLIEAHIAASRAEIRRITLHHLSIAAQQGVEAACA